MLGRETFPPEVHYSGAVLLRVCFIGNSHLAALRQGWNRLGYGGVEIDFCAARGAYWETFRLSGTRLSARHPTAKADLVRTSGSESVDLSDYDVICVHALGLGIFSATRAHVTHGFRPRATDTPHIVSENAFRDALVDALSRTTSGKMVRAIAKAVDIPVLAVAQPCALETILEAGDVVNTLAIESGAEEALSRLTSEAASAAYPCPVLFQPPETLARPILTTGSFGTGSISMVTGEEHKKKDFLHMNADFGAIMLQEILRHPVFGQGHPTSTSVASSAV